MPDSNTDNNLWLCTCAQPDCPECGTGWARASSPDEPPQGVQLGPGVWRLDDGTYRIDF